MKKAKSATIEVQGTVIGIVSEHATDYICLTDIARFKNPDATDDLIRNWLRNRNTVEFLGVWERLNNPHFNPVEFDGIKIQAGLNSFTLTPANPLNLEARFGPGPLKQKSRTCRSLVDSHGAGPNFACSAAKKAV